jgi:large subunit ribosomal protein L30
MLLVLQSKEEFRLIKFLMVNNYNKMATIKYKQVRSAINRSKRQKDTIKALGLKKLNHVVEKEATPQIMGMINKVQHLVVIVD